MKLRTIILAVICITAPALTGAGYAYAGDGTPAIDTSRPDRTIEVGVHVGDGFATIRQNYDSAIPTLSDLVMNAGNKFLVGAGATIPLRDFLAIGTRLEFSVNKYNWAMTLLDRNIGTLSTVYCKNTYYTLDIPAYLQLRVNLGSRVRWRSEFGAYLSLGTGGNSRINEAVSSTNALGQSQVTERQYKDKYFNDPNPVVNGINDLDWGLHLATGILVDRHWAFDWTVRIGARDIAKNMGVLDISIHQLTGFFSVGYVF